MYTAPPDVELDVSGMCCKYEGECSWRLLFTSCRMH